MTDHQRVPCPRCGQDWVERVNLVHLLVHAFMCPECEALWLEEGNIAPPSAGSYGQTWFDYSTFMESKGRQAPQSEGEIEVLGPYLLRG